MYDQLLFDPIAFGYDLISFHECICLFIDAFLGKIIHKPLSGVVFPQCTTQALHTLL